jgi:hypothetical protein
MDGQNVALTLRKLERELAAGRFSPDATVDPQRLRIQPTEQLAAAVGEADRLLALRPADRQLELHQLRTAHARLLRERAQTITELDQWQRQLEQLGPVRRHNPATRQVRDTLETIIADRTRVLARLDEQLPQTSRQLGALEHAHQEVAAWYADHAGELTLGLAAAQDLQARERQAISRLAANPPAYLHAELGDTPTDAAARQAWERAAVAIERYRGRYRIDDPQRALGERPPTFPGQIAYDQVALNVEYTKAEITQAQQLTVQAPDGPDGGISISLGGID